MFIIYTQYLSSPGNVIITLEVHSQPIFRSVRAPVSMAPLFEILMVNFIAVIDVTSSVAMAMWISVSLSLPYFVT